MMRLKDDLPLMFKWGEVKVRKYTNAASNWAGNVLQASPMLQCHWRVSYNKEEKEVSPKKPLWFLKDAQRLTKGSCLRVL